MGERQKQKNRFVSRGHATTGRRRAGGSGLQRDTGTTTTAAPWPANVACQRGLPGPVANPNHAARPGPGPGPGQNPAPHIRGSSVPEPGAEPGTRASAAGKGSQAPPGPQPAGEGPRKEAPRTRSPAALPETGGHRHSLSVMSPRPWAYSRSRSRVTSSFSSRISLLLGSSLMTALQRICLARSAYLGSTGSCGPRDTRSPTVAQLQGHLGRTKSHSPPRSRCPGVLRETEAPGEKRRCGIFSPGRGLRPGLAGPGGTEQVRPTSCTLCREAGAPTQAAEPPPAPRAARRAAPVSH